MDNCLGIPRPKKVWEALLYCILMHLLYALLAWGRAALVYSHASTLCFTVVGKIGIYHMQLPVDYNQKIPTFHSIYDYLALLTATQIPLIFIISKTNYLLINRLISTTPNAQ